jgi:hypothetical protein
VEKRNIVGPFFKNKTPRSEKYKAWIRTQPCVVCGRTGETIAPAHMATGGTSIKASDYYCLPLCYDHHAEEHRGHKTFAEKHNIDIGWKIAEHLEAYVVEKGVKG